MRIKTSGKVSEPVLKRSVMKEVASYVKREPYSLGIGQDATEFKMDSSSSLCIATATMEGSHIEYLNATFIRALNNILVKGAIPYGISVSICLCHEAKETDLKVIMRQMQLLCETYQVKLLGGETLVSTASKEHVFTVTMLGNSNGNKYAKSIDNEAYLVMTKSAGIAGTAILTKKYMEQLKERYTTTFLEGATKALEDLSIQREMFAVKKEDFIYAHDISEGGIFSALWEVGEYLNCGMTINLDKIKLSQETIEICEYFDINPYLLFSLGSVIYVTLDYHSLMETLKEHQIDAFMIGTVNTTNNRLIINQDETRFLEPYKEDELFKINII